MEHRASCLVGLLGFGFVAYVLIRLASQINTHPDVNHFVPPTRPPAPGPRPTPTVDVEARQEADRQRATAELLVDLAASQYADRARVQLLQARRSVSQEISCTLSAKRPLMGNASATPPRAGVWAWTGTFQCTDERAAYEVTFPVNLVFENDRWEIDAGTRKILSEGGFLAVSVRDLAPAAPPAPVVFPERSRS